MLTPACMEEVRSEPTMFEFLSMPWGGKSWELVTALLYKRILHGQNGPLLIWYAFQEKKT